MVGLGRIREYGVRFLYVLRGGGWRLGKFGGFKIIGYFEGMRWEF